MTDSSNTGTELNRDKRQTVQESWVYPYIQKGTKRMAELAGWTIDLSYIPEPRKYVMIVAPHTSNWDFPFVLPLAANMQRRVSFLGKDALFKGLHGRLFRWLTGIPVERGSRHNFVDQLVEVFNSTDELALVVAPEGTRGKIDKWKSGFYHIAHQANVPIVAVYADFERKVVGVQGIFHPSGDFAADLPKIKAMYADVAACHPENDGTKTPSSG